MIETLNVSETVMTEQPLLTEQSLTELTPDPNNARLHDSNNLDMIQSSLQELGAGRSILIDENNVILAGNGVAQAAQQAGMTRVQIVEADGDAIIAVRRRNLTPEQKTRLALFDNRTGDLSTFDPMMLAGLQAEGVSLEGLWSAGELDELLADLPSFEDVSPFSLAEPSPAYKEMIAGAAERGAANDRQSDEEIRLRRQNTQESEVSPRPPSADTQPYKAPEAPTAAAETSPAPVPGLDRVTPDQETSRPGLFMHFRALKIPLSEDEGKRLDVRLAAYRESAGTFYGFVGSLLGLADTPEQKPDQKEAEDGE